MIVITSLRTTTRYVYPGDTFNLIITDELGAQVIIKEEITIEKKIDFIASFRFVLEDGRCPGFHLIGIFADSEELPKEIKEAKMLNDLTPQQYRNFVESVGVKLKKKTKKVKKKGKD